MGLAAPETDADRLAASILDQGFDAGWDAALEMAAKICETHAVRHRGTEPIGLMPSTSGEPVGKLFGALIRTHL